MDLRAGELRPDVAEDWRWADQYIPFVKATLKKYAMHIVDFEVAPIDKDMTEGTDMVVRVSGGDVAVRIRRDDCRFRDLTIRAWRKSGAKTEIDKIRAGHIDFYLYCWTDKEDGLIRDYILVDINIARDSGLFDDGSLILNPDKRTGFYPYSIQRLEEVGALIASTL